MSAIYRVRQFVRAAGALVRPSDGDEVLASRHLPPAAANLFLAMPRYDRQHALGVLHTLRVQGHAEPDLLAAALLHDVGKTLQPHGALRLWHRVAIVLMRAFWPGLLERIGAEQPGSWRYPFFVQQHHAAISAELAQGAGCSAAVVELIRRHEDPPDQADDPLLSALQIADSLN
jgi:hypothetical protein